MIFHFIYWLTKLIHICTWGSQVCQWAISVQKLKFEKQNHLKCSSWGDAIHKKQVQPILLGLSLICIKGKIEGPRFLWFRLIVWLMHWPMGEFIIENVFIGGLDIESFGCDKSKSADPKGVGGLWSTALHISIGWHRAIFWSIYVVRTVDNL